MREIVYQKVSRDTFSDHCTSLALSLSCTPPALPAPPGTKVSNDVRYSDNNDHVCGLSHVLTLLHEMEAGEALIVHNVANLVSPC